MLIFNPLSCFSPRPFFPSNISRVVYTQVLVTQLCLTLCDPMDCSSSGSFAHGISQARILEWVAIFFSRESSQPRNQTCISCTGRWIPYHRATGEAPLFRLELSYSFFDFCKAYGPYLGPRILMSDISLGCNKCFLKWLFKNDHR